MRKKSKLIFGVGINDANYDVTVHEGRKITWICPIYIKQRGMLERCYCDKFKVNHKSYTGCSVVPIWHSFMSFREWVLTQDWQGKELDKDILFPKNKIYSPDTCVFIEQKLNCFITDSLATRGLYPIGVDFHKASGRFRSRCLSVVTGKSKFLGYFSGPQEAHEAWLAYKLQQAHILAAEQSDPRVAAALIDRYENYSKYFDQGT